MDKQEVLDWLIAISDKYESMAQISHDQDIASKYREGAAALRTAKALLDGEE